MRRHTRRCVAETAELLILHKIPVSLPPQHRTIADISAGLTVKVRDTRINDHLAGKSQRIRERHNPHSSGGRVKRVEHHVAPVVKHILHQGRPRVDTPSTVKLSRGTASP